MRESLKELSLTRFREFIREPEALFWSLLFPILLSVGLGMAFRNRPAEVVHVAVVSERAASAQALAALRASKALAAESLSLDSARYALRTGRVALLVHMNDARNVWYEYDDTRPDARMTRSSEPPDAPTSWVARTSSCTIVARGTSTLSYRDCWDSA